MKILALMGSPRKRGNSDLLVEAFIEGAKSRGAETGKIWMNDLVVHGCQACLACHKTGRCRQKDDMVGVYERLLEADTWLLATPIYCWGPTAQIKSAIDRLYSFCYGDKPKLIKGKKMVLITTSADAPRIATPYTVGMFKDLCKYMQMEWVGELSVQAGAKGDVAHKGKELDRARELGAKVAGKSKSAKA